MPLDTERGKIAHLLRRAGFSPSAPELDAAERKGRDALLDELLNPERVPDPAEAALPTDAIDYARPVNLPLWWMLRMVKTARPLQEKLALFWHGHLTSSITRVNQLRFTMIAQNEFFRRNGLGSFRDLIIGVSKDPAMIQWLDSNTNRKGKPNENYARELLELFTLGRGQYSESDIREAARAFTGWFQRDGVFAFTPGQHDTGQKTIFGRTGNWDGTDVCEMAVSHPAAGPFLTRKLWEFFAYRNPEPDVVGDLARVYSSSGYDIRAVLRALFMHPAFYSERAYHAVVKSPVEVIVGFLRSLEAKVDLTAPPETRLQLASQLTGAATAMGQTLFSPPNVAGWPGGPAWVSTTALITRYNFAATAARDGYAATSIDVAGLLNRAGATVPERIVDHFAGLIVDGDLTAEQRQTLLDYLIAGDNGRPGAFTLTDATIARKVRGLLYLLATTPQYQLA
jgi:uncharacterized protein (DUF1800 family)